MGIAEETVGVESESQVTTKKWVISGIQFMPPLKPIYTKKAVEPHDEEKEEERCTTPTMPESKIPCLRECPGAPRKRKAVSRSHFTDYFNPPDLETVFIPCCVERA